MLIIRKIEGSTLMKKMILKEYGSVDIMKMADVEIPSPSAQQLVIKTAVIGVNDPDIVIRQAGPAPTMPKDTFPPLPHSLDEDFSGVVTAIGEAVTRFKVVDHVVVFSNMKTYMVYILDAQLLEHMFTLQERPRRATI